MSTHAPHAYIYRFDAAVAPQGASKTPEAQSGETVRAASCA